MPRFLDYVLSLHFLPLGAAVVLPCLGYSLGAGWWVCAALGTTSLLISAGAFYFEPLLCLAPMGGRFNVGLREFDGELGSMRPPVTVYYPTTAAVSANGVHYLPYNDTNYLRGMASYAGLPYFLLMDLFFMRFKVRLDATPAPLLREDGTPRPVFLFSHGLAGFPQLYSTMLMDLAARGMIVFCVTHMDASAAYCRDATDKIHIPLNNTLEWTTKDREPQLDIRVRETRNTIPRICETGELLRSLGYEPQVVEAYLATEPQVHLAGHSFGGATVLATALEEEQAAKAAHKLSSVASVVAFDPWSVPLREKMFYGKLTDPQNPVVFATPTFQTFSESWIRDKGQYEFFTKVKSVVQAQQRTPEETALLDAADKKLKKRGETWYSMKDIHGTGHLTCTDASLFSPVVYRQGYMTVPPRAAILDMAHDTVQFVNALAGPLPIEKDLANDPQLAAILRR